MGSLKKRNDFAGIFCWISTIVIQDSNCQIITVVFLDGKEDSREGLKIPYLKVCINGAAKSSSEWLLVWVFVWIDGLLFHTNDKLFYLQDWNSLDWKYYVNCIIFFRSWKQEKPSEKSGGFSIKFDLQHYYYLF